MSRARRRHTASVRSFSRLPLSDSAFEELRPPDHSVCGSDGRGQTAEGSGSFSIRNDPPVFDVSSPVMSSATMYRVFFARAASARSHSRPARISSPQTNVMVRAGGGIAFAATAAAIARAIS